MNNMKILLPNVLFFFILSGPVIAEEWKLGKNSDGISIFTRKTDQSSIEQFRGTVKIESSMAAAVALIQDMDSVQKWIHYSKSGKTLTKNGKSSLTYTITNLPWPLNNRDIVVNNTLTQSNDGTVTIKFEGAPDSYPVTENMIRIRKLTGDWVLVPAENHMVSVTYTVLSEPGGRIPSWVVNMGIVDQPFITLQNMRKMVKNSPWKEAVIAGIEER